jgi:hypothetical protein
MLDGVIEEMIGAGFWSTSGETLEMPADGDGFSTVIGTWPAGPVISDARMEAVSCVELTNCVTRLRLFT